MSKTPARIAYEAALQGAKKGRGRFPVASKDARTVHGTTLASAKERRRYEELRLLEKQGVISHLERQPVFKVSLNGKHLCRYSADFSYFQNGERIIEDAKSSGTKKDPYYRLRKRAAEIAYHIKVREV